MRADGRALIYTYRLKPVATDDGFYRAQGAIQKQLLELYCSRKYWNERDLEVTEIQTFYSSPGEWLTSFSIGPKDCPQW